MKLTVSIPPLPPAPAPAGLKAPKEEDKGADANVVAATRAAQGVPMAYADKFTSGLTTSIVAGENTFEIQLSKKFAGKKR